MLPVLPPTAGQHHRGMARTPEVGRKRPLTRSEFRWTECRAREEQPKSTGWPASSYKKNHKDVAPAQILRSFVQEGVAFMELARKGLILTHETKPASFILFGAGDIDPDQHQSSRRLLLRAEGKCFVSRAPTNRGTNRNHGSSADKCVTFASAVLVPRRQPRATAVKCLRRCCLPSRLPAW